MIKQIKKDIQRYFEALFIILGYLFALLGLICLFIILGR